MIKRIWHGWTSHENADVYEKLLKREIFPGIEAKKVKGYRNIELLRRPLEDEVEFITVMQFETLDDVKNFVGEEYETAYVPERARAVLKRFDKCSQHYEQRERRDY